MKEDISWAAHIITYMLIRPKVKLKLSLVILPKIVYDYSSTMIFNQIKLHRQEKFHKNMRNDIYMHDSFQVGE